MRTRHFIAIGFATLAITGFLFAKASHVPLSQKCKKSDLIAVIEITETKTGGASKPYRKIATARITETIKGRIDVATFKLDFDNGLACPNILYKRGDRCLVFLSKLPTGHFTTYNSYYGAYTVSNDTVIDWEYKADTKLPNVRQEILKHVE
ncbi:MAG: hypothetical protein H0X66_19670 [Verrucomicrobia bacterium]|nr:hypothetical protein [Verrucomicrobiota bacterium]